jgi:phosphomannomutase / phosphoglucomutase
MPYFEFTDHLPQNIFRAYDIRGIVTDTLTPNIVYTIAHAIAAEAIARQQTEIIVARDGRLSSPELLQAVIAGFGNSGLHVIDVGAVPTPILYFATHILTTRSGVMVTGSHNPRDYNGLKIMLAGKTLAGEDIQCLYQRSKNRDFIEGVGQVRFEDVIEQYIARICQDVQLVEPLKVVIDCGNGITASVAPQLFKRLGCEVIELFCEVDGQFPHHHPDPSQAENLQDLMTAVTNHQADIGLAFDGDGDRLGVVTNRGEVIWPDRQLMLFAMDILQRSPGATILFDVKCTQLLKNLITEYGGQPVMWKVGHSFIKGKMQEIGALLAGEMSGHIFFQERWYGFDDALYAGARLLEILAKQTRCASELFQLLPDAINTPELQVPVADEEKFDFMQQLTTRAQFADGRVTTIDGLRVDFEYGWGLVRPSNTTPNLVLRFEADSLPNLREIQKLFREQLLAVNSDLNLPF